MSLIRLSVSTLIPSVIALIQLVSCSNGDQRAPTRTSSGLPNNGNSGSSISSGGGNSDSTELEESDAQTAVSLTGKVEAFSDNRFNLTIPLTETGTILAQSAIESDEYLSAFYDGASYTLIDVLASSDTWLEYNPEDPVNNFATLTRGSTVSGEYDLRVVPRIIIEDLMGFASQIASPNPERAQLILRAVDSLGNPASNINFSVPGTEFTLYATASTWSEELQATTNSGLFFGANIDVTAQRTSLPVIINDGELRDQTVLLSPGSVTYLQIIVDDASP